MNKQLKITAHAGKAYGRREYNDEMYFWKNPSKCYEEIRERLKDIKKSDFDPRAIFNGVGGKDRKKGIKAKDILLFEDDKFIYAVRDNNLITIFPLPGTDIISTFLYPLKK